MEEGKGRWNQSLVSAHLKDMEEGQAFLAVVQ